MDSVYLSHPLLLLFFAVLLGAELLTHFLPKLAFPLTVACVLLCAVFCGCVLVAGGTLYEFVLALLACCVLSMALGAREHKKEQAKAPADSSVKENEGKEDTAK